MIWTIGHSVRSIEDFISLLREHQIELLCDVRRFPASRRYPHFSKAALSASLAAEGIEYVHFADLGGHRQPRADSRNTAWRHEAFRGYADYMQTEPFRQAVERLLAAAKDRRAALMCAEADWRSCHRSLLSDYLKSIGIDVLHIRDSGVEPHPYTKQARIVEGRLSYCEPQGSLF